MVPKLSAHVSVIIARAFKVISVCSVSISHSPNQSIPHSATRVIFKAVNLTTAPPCLKVLQLWFSIASKRGRNLWSVGWNQLWSIYIKYFLTTYCEPEKKCNSCQHLKIGEFDRKIWIFCYYENTGSSSNTGLIFCVKIIKRFHLEGHGFPSFPQDCMLPVFFSHLHDFILLIYTICLAFIGI